MLLGRRARALVVIAAAVAFGCAEPPDKEMQQAQGAIDAARAAGADEYAHDEFAAAQDALKRAQDAVNERDYRLALNHALDSRERAQNAAKESANHKATARSDAERALADANAALADARGKLKALEAARVPAAKLAGARTAIETGDSGVQKARAAFGRGEYLAAIDLAKGATAGLRGTARDLEAAAPATAHRRR